MPRRSASPTLSELPDVLSVRQVAEFCGLAENSVYDSCRRGELPSRKVGRRIVILKSALVGFLQGDTPASLVGPSSPASGEGGEV